jgi:FixJ family two-component response regulator
LSALSVISVIDDDASVRAATNNLVRSLGHTVHTFASAEEFLRSAHLNDTSCVIADVQMPAMSGVELLTLMRTQGYRVPFIFITAFPDESVRARALKAGAISFLAKPFAAPTLIKCLGTALKGHPGGADT